MYVNASFTLIFAWKEDKFVQFSVKGEWKLNWVMKRNMNLVGVEGIDIVAVCFYNLLLYALCRSQVALVSGFNIGWQLTNIQDHGGQVTNELQKSHILPQG